MKRKIKKIALALIALIAISILIAGKYAANSKICTQIEITIKSINAPKFLTKKQILEYLTNTTNTKLTGVRCKDLDLNLLEQALDTNPYIANAEVIRDMTQGKLRIDIWFSEPIVKVFAKNSQFYIDDKGFIYPMLTNQRFHPYTLVANGDIDANLKIKSRKHLSEVVDTNKSKIYQIYKIAKFIHHNQFWRTYITQIYYNKQSIELIPRVGDFVIILGDISDYEKKFRNLHAFLQNLNRLGWEKYSKINLSYANQIVCTKN